MCRGISKFYKAAISRWTDLLWGMGIGLIPIGIVVWIISYIFSDINSLSVALGLFSVALGLVAISIGGKADLRMRAMANLEFDEKMGVIQTHIERIKKNMNPVADQIYYDVSGCVRLQNWMGKSERTKLREKIFDIIKAMEWYKDNERQIWEESKYADLTKQLRTLEQQVKK